jgi:hypothetical protein
VSNSDEALALSAVQKTQRLADSLASALTRLRDRSPLTTAFVRDATDEDKDLMDAFVHRYGKLQDMLGAQLFRSVLLLDLEDPPASMMDLVNAVAKRGIVDDLAEWAELRKTRNRLVHEYEDAPERAAAALQHAIDVAAPMMLTVQERAASYITRRLSQRQS